MQEGCDRVNVVNTGHGWDWGCDHPLDEAAAGATFSSVEDRAEMGEGCPTN